MSIPEWAQSKTVLVVLAAFVVILIVFAAAGVYFAFTGKALPYVGDVLTAIMGLAGIQSAGNNVPKTVSAWRGNGNSTPSFTPPGS